MKKIILFLAATCSSVAFAQVGINTENPIHLLHTDGQNDNPTTGTPNSAQQVNDVVITEYGEIGIGTITPEEKLHLKEGNALIDGKLGVGNADRNAGLAVKNTNGSEPILSLTSTSNVERLIVTENGEMGINTTPKALWISILRLQV